jgi:choline dehydrogenase-like flavoprotein
MPREARNEAVLRRAQHGTHQVGTIRMGANRRTAIVDRDCRTFDVANLHVLSTAVLPTSSQANPTFTAVELALRFAESFASGG